MKTYISLLRGINVSGQKIIKMDALRELYLSIGFANVKTYLQSGNVVFQYEENNNVVLDIATIAEKIEKEIIQKFHFQVPVLVKNLDELKQIAENNPFAKDESNVKDVSSLHVTFLADTPTPENMAKIISLQHQQDEFHVIGEVIYLYCPNGYGNSKLTNNFFEQKLKVTATTRNWKTINELVKIGEVY